MFSKIALLLATTLLSALVPAPVKAVSVSFTGTFQQDDNIRLFGFTLGAPSTVTLETWSYGGGSNAQGNTISRGGFETALSLFSGSGTLLNVANNPSLAGSCPPQNPDGVTGLCGDSFLMTTLPAGSYFAALTEYFNIPNGLTLASGFLEDGQGNFTGPTLCGTGGSFFDSTCNHRNGNFALDLVGVTTATAVPEPARLALFGSALLLVAALLRRHFSSHL